MKALSVIILASFIFLSGCNKPSGENDPEPDYTIVVPASTVSTVVTVYSRKMNAEVNNGIASVNGLSVIQEYQAASSGQINTDPLNTRVSSSPEAPGSGFQFFSHERVVPVTSSSRNYVDTRIVNRIIIGHINQTADYWLLQGGGKLSFGANSFINNPSTGFVDACGYWFDPLAMDFSIGVPSFTADFDQRRWYLKSFGAALISLDYYWSIKPGADVRLTLPIPTTLATEAPDSIPAWCFIDHAWQRKGTAYKTANGYEAKIDKAGIWNFALPVNGVYAVLKVRTDKGVAVTNAKFHVKMRNREVASARTDADGNLICFVPAREELELQAPAEWYPYTSLFTQSLGSFASAKTADVIIRSTTANLVTVKGTAKTCSGGNIANGTVVMRDRDNKFANCYIPVRNGQYSSALFKYNDQINLLKLFDPGSNTAGGDSAVVLKTTLESTFNLNSCVPSTYLFMRYTFDGVEKLIEGDFSHSNTPYLNGHTNPYLIAGQNGNDGVQFISSNGSTDFSGIWVDNIFYNHIFGTPANLTFTRFDLVPNPNGYIEGSIDIFIKKSSDNISHHLIAKFRVKRN